MKINYRLKRCIRFFSLLIIFLIFLGGICEATKLKLRIKVPKANIRLKPTTESNVISQAPLGAILESEEKIGNWYKVNLPPDESGIIVSGYIHENIVEVIEEIKEVPKEEKVKEKKPPEVTPPKVVAEKEEKEARIEQPTPVPRIEPIKRYSFRAGLGLSFPTGDWSDLFKLGLGLNVGNGLLIVRKPTFNIELLGSAGAHIFFRKAGYTEISWTRFILAADSRINLKVDPVTLFAQGGLGLYLDVLEIKTWWWKEEGSELKFGPRIGGGIALGNLEITAMYHMVEDSMFIVMGSVIMRF